MRRRTAQEDITGSQKVVELVKTAVFLSHAQDGSLQLPLPAFDENKRAELEHEISEREQNKFVGMSGDPLLDPMVLEAVQAPRYLFVGLDALVGEESLEGLLDLVAELRGDVPVIDDRRLVLGVGVRNGCDHLQCSRHGDSRSQGGGTVGIRL